MHMLLFSCLLQAASTIGNLQSKIVKKEKETFSKFHGQARLKGSFVDHMLHAWRSYEIYAVFQSYMRPHVRFCMLHHAYVYHKSDQTAIFLGKKYDNNNLIKF